MSISVDNQARISQLELLYTRLKVKSEKTIISETEPESPTVGTAWFDTTTLAFKTWEGNMWSEATTVNSLTIGSSPDWFRVDGDGNMWSGRENLSTAQSETFAVLNTGQLYAKNAVISGDITITGGDTSLDDINDGSTYKRVTSNEKTGADRAYGALNSNDRYQKWLTAGDMDSATLPTNGVVFGSQGIVGRNSGSTTFQIDTDGNAYFKGDIGASSISASVNISTGSISTGTVDNNVSLNGGRVYFENYDGFQGAIYSIGPGGENNLDGIEVAGDLFLDTIQIQGTSSNAILTANSSGDLLVNGSPISGGWNGEATSTLNMNDNNIFNCADLFCDNVHCDDLSSYTVITTISIATDLYPKNIRRDVNMNGYGFTNQDTLSFKEITTYTPILSDYDSSFRVTRNGVAYYIDWA